MSKIADISSQFLTPLCAQQKIQKCYNAFQETLINGGYEGTYSLHSGFDEETFGLQEPDEIIIIILETQISDTLSLLLDMVFDPIPTVVGTPNDLFEGPGGEVDGKPGVDGREPQETPAVSTGGVGDQKGRANNQGSLDQGGAGGGRGDTSGSEGGIGRGSEGGDGRGGSRGHSHQGSGDAGDGDEDRRRNTSTTGSDGPITDDTLEVPFISILRGKDHRLEDFRTEGRMEIKIHKKPITRLWNAPCVGIDVIKLVSQTDSPSNYICNQMQITIAALNAPDISVVEQVPDIVYTQDTLTTREDSNFIKSTMLNVAVPPSANAGVQAGTTRSSEITQQRWEITSRAISGQDEGLQEHSKGMMWHYRHNLEGGFTPVTHAKFTPPPLGVFGLHAEQPRLPLLEAIGEKVRSKLTWTKKTLPAHLNFVHRVVLTIDLQNFSRGGHGNMTNTKAVDAIPDQFADRDSFTLPAHKLSVQKVSDSVEVTLEQAVQGQIGTWDYDPKPGELAK
ncbi:hypothetical protein DXG01_015745 [Tephrocybe rancida]|nr:hypothetical protein DXG01_015745 [Tephrocybe rancida]